MPVVTLSHEIGAGGPEIGQKLAERLSLHYVDQELISQAALRYGLREEKLSSLDESKPSLLERFDADLEDIGLIDSLTDVGLRVRSDPRFSKCRALDAIHACTALLMREWTGRAVRLATFDERLEKLGVELRLM